MSDTLESHWQRLGLDSLLPAEPADLRATRPRTWDARTLKVERSAAVTERTDLPRLSLAAPAQPAPGPEPRELAVIGLLGEGGMGQVLLARQLALGRDVAVKVAHADAPEAAVQALLQEARTTGALEHPCVIPVYALASDVAGRPALVMKRVDGVPWRRLLSDSDPAWERVVSRCAGHLEAHVDILLQVCNAIAFAHRRGVLHRDVKPENVLVGEFGEVYLADWGVATHKPEPGEERPPALVGTPCFMAPEMVTGDDSRMDERTDVFLLGATLYEVLAGRPPWDGRELREVCRAAWECAAPPLPAGAPEELARVCRRAMARAPEDRYQGVVELREALGDFLRHRGSVKLATAARERLEALRAALAAGGADRPALWALLSESRFGFAQALREWPENQPARAGVQECLATAARLEVAQRNAAAARALLRELEQVPADLERAVAQLEAAEAASRATEARIRHLSKEFDPRVALRQRVVFVAALAATTGALVVARNTVPWLREASARHGSYFMLAIMLAISTVYGVGLWWGRRSLLSTRVNRRIAAVVGAAVLGSDLNRALAILTGSAVPATLVGDLCIMCAVSFCGGFLLHWGFWGGSAILGLGALAGALWPEAVSPIFGVAAVAALGVVAYSWRTWRSELSVDAGGD